MSISESQHKQENFSSRAVEKLTTEEIFIDITKLHDSISIREFASIEGDKSNIYWPLLLLLITNQLNLLVLSITPQQPPTVFTSVNLIILVVILVTSISFLIFRYVEKANKSKRAEIIKRVRADYGDLFCQMEKELLNFVSQGASTNERRDSAGSVNRP